MDINVIIAVFSLLTGWLLFLEKRLHAVKQEIETRLREVNHINEVVQNGLNNDIARLEAKIDQLIQMQLMKSYGLGNRNAQD